MRPHASASDKCCGAQPERRVAEPLSSIAPRKVCDRVGLTAPAQASHSACGISAIAAWTLSVIVSVFPFIARRSLELDRNTAGQRIDPDRGAGMPALVAEHLDHQVGGAVDDLRHVGEVGGAVD